MSNEGDRIPDVRLEGMNGETLNPSDFRGQKLVLYFYPKDDTPGCTTEAKDFSALLKDFADEGTWIIGVSKDPPTKHQKFSAKYGLAVPLATDGDGSVCEAFGTWVEKNLYGRKYMGIERSTFLIDRDGIISRVWRKVKVKGHAAEVLEAAKDLP